MIYKIQRAEMLQIEDVCRVFNTVVTALPYYNEMAIKNELFKYKPTDIASKIESDPDSVLVACEDDKILGFCFNRVDDMTIWIEWFGVVEGCRRSGIAKGILEYLETTSKSRNVHKIWCDCRTENLKTIKLLSVCGFTPLCTVKNHWYKQDFILWEKEINHV